MFNSLDLSILAYANKFTLWHYTTTDKLSTLQEGNYFGKAADMFQTNDVIICISDTDDTPSTDFLVVASNDGTQVRVECKWSDNIPNA
jgi:hypothetical protein